MDHEAFSCLHKSLSNHNAAVMATSSWFGLTLVIEDITVSVTGVMDRGFEGHIFTALCEVSVSAFSLLASPGYSCTKMRVALVLVP